MIATITTLLWFTGNVLETAKLCTSILKYGTIDIAHMHAAFVSASS